MKFTVSATAMRSALFIATKAISSKNMLPILDYVKLDFPQWEDSQMTITGSNLETTITVVLPVSEAEGLKPVCLPARICSDMLAQLPEQPITFEIDTDSLNVEVRYQNGHYSLTGQLPDEFPATVLADADALRTTIDGALLNRICARLAPYAANDELRPVMNGIYFDFRKERLTTVASDGHRLLRWIHSDIVAKEPGAFILPAGIANVLKTGIKSGEVSVVFDATNIHFTTENEGITITCRQIEGRYPNYNSVIPEDNPFTLTVNRLELIAAIRRVQVMSDKNIGIIRLGMKSMDDSVSVDAQNIDFSTSAEESVTGTHNISRPFRIGFKGDFLRTLLETASSDLVDIRLSDPSRASITTEHEGDDSLLLLLMPMMIPD